MKHLINREDYIVEYLRINKNIENDDELNEGLLGTVFGGLKMLLKKDWAGIKCKNPSVITYLKEIDKSLAGYTMTKMKFSSECQNIRQNIANYFSDILDYKLSQIEKIEDGKGANEYLDTENKEKENSEEKGVNKKLNIKDKTIQETLNKYKENISTACKADPKLREYADQMLNAVTIFVNDVILAELEKKGADKAKIEEEEKKLKEEENRLKEIRKKMDEESKKAGEEAIKKIAKERDAAFKSLGVKPIATMDGDKAIDEIAKQFKDMLGEFNNTKLNESALPDDYSEILRSDTYIGISGSLSKVDWNITNGEENTPEALYDKLFMRVILNKIDTVYDVISKNKSMFKTVPSASVQAMMIALSNAVIYGFRGDDFDIKGPILTLLTKCAIDSDATIGFNLPLIDPEKPENGNFFVSIMNRFKNADISSKEVEDAVKSITTEEAESILKLWNSETKDDGGSESGEDNQVNLKEFAKDFGPKVMKNFRHNMTNLFDMIIKKANKLKEDAAKKREVEAAKAKQQSEKEENKTE